MLREFQDEIKRLQELLAVGAGAAGAKSLWSLLLLFLLLHSHLIAHWAHCGSALLHALARLPAQACTSTQLTHGRPHPAIDRVRAAHSLRLTAR